MKLTINYNPMYKLGTTQQAGFYLVEDKINDMYNIFFDVREFD